MKKQTVYVGLSGGVDSSIAAALLLAAGYQVVGVFIKVWQPDFLVCNWEQERVAAMRVAAQLGIPFLTFDATETYKKTVADYFIASYQKGITPNPDIYCNKEVKFGVFQKFALAKGADYIATGHYARIDYLNQNPVLLRGVDTNKDQSYFLWSLNADQLKQTLFPIGHLYKSQVRKLAKKYRLPTADKKDSQGICFLGAVDIPDFLAHYSKLTNGVIKNQTGETIGTHHGALVYTIGQRHGLTITNKKYSGAIFYVVAKNISTNTLLVDTKKPKITSSNIIKLYDCLFREILKPGDKLQMQTHYRQKPTAVTILERQLSACQLLPLQTTETPAPGQSCVLYRGEVCVGGGIIC